ncbi:MAG: 1-deoxy-D-xylulose-5-phosphate synthase [Lachnospiraceae bacterium]|nr:1-deoxy-D-xylulose-5-phosphate synthase [Lachnospiraceae bacterium]
MILDRINKENDIKKIPESEWPRLAEEIREYILTHVSEKGGHLAPNLGVVELTMALHLFMDFPKDKLIFDVGHQCYTHKILTGRKNDFDTLRQYHGLSGFPKRDESPCDSFDSGHSSNSISAGLGFAAARCLNRTDEKIVCLIGDGAMTGGVAYEALNNVSLVNGNFIIVLNDNQMSISENVGGFSSQLSRLRTGKIYTSLKDSVTDSLEKIPGVGDPLVRAIRRTKNSLKQLMVPGMFFEEMGIKYLGPVDGHNVKEVLKLFRYASRIDGPVLVHVVTKKGKGYEFAEKHPDKYHGTGPFELATGETKKGNPSYTDVFSKAMLRLGEKNEKLVAITAAMADGTGLKKYKVNYPERFFDVGIAEGHAVTFSTGLALSGKIPVFAVYSSFLQRGFDEIAQDVCMQKAHVIFAIDRAGLVGNDGPTHHGVFDIAYMQGLPNMVLMAPKNGYELTEMMKFAVEYNGPIALRYPRGEAYQGLKELKNPIELGKSEVIKEGRKVCLIAYGSMVKNAFEASLILQEEGIDVGVVNLRFAKPLDYDMLRDVAGKYDTVITVEDHAVYSGAGVMISDFYEREGIANVKIIHLGIPDKFIEQGSTAVLYKDCGLDIDSIVSKVKEIY